MSLANSKEPRIQYNRLVSSEETCTIDNDERKPSSSSTNQKILCSKLNLCSIILFIIIIISTILYFTRFRFLSIKLSTSHSFIAEENNGLIYLIKEGLPYGDRNSFQNESFNDAQDLALSYIDRCIDVQLQWTKVSLVSIQFIYSNNRSSKRLSIQKETLTPEFSNNLMLTKNEEINKINLFSRNSIIIGIQFRTTHGRKSKVFGSNNGQFLTESFENYTFSHAKGKQENDKGIQMLQFTWLKQTSSKQPIAAEIHNMREICEFTFKSKKDVQIVRIQGIESSWYDLKRKFHRQGDNCDSIASYYEKIHPKDRGPELFAIVNNNSVFYHDEGVWRVYITAKNITCYMKPWFVSNSS